MATRFLLLPVLLLMAWCSPAARGEAAAHAATRPVDPTARTTTRPATTQAGARAGDHVFVTHHSVRVGDRTLNYTATAGTLAQKDESGTTKADMFFVAYTLDRVGGGDGSRSGGDGDGPTASTAPAAATRPVTFVFNGGPGAASVWLHLGAAGPMRVDLGDQAVPARPPFHLVRNESTWLDATDLVFIDPVGTGYSRPAEGQKGEQFYGVQEDVRSVGSFIRLYTTRYDRWLSPKFLAGESYGTTRAAGLSEYLLEKQGISLNGIVLISTVLNFQALIPAPGNDLPYPLLIPTYTATAAYHKKLAPELAADLSKTLKEVEAWSLNQYAPALAQGDALPETKLRDVAAQLARYTGLPVDFVVRSKLRIDPGRFRKELLADDGKIIGRFDTRITGFASDLLDRDAGYDPSLSLVLPVYTATLTHYVRETLKYESDLPYEVLTERVQPWNFGQRGTGYLYVADTLRDTMLKNPQLKVLVGAGRLDLATPFFSADYTINHLGLPPELRKNITHTYYDAGHMMYHDPASRKQLHDDVARFVRAAATARVTLHTAPPGASAPLP
jgi:carboxypeptidase C (cathepsin A)